MANGARSLGLCAPGGGYSLYDGWYICAAVLTPSGYQTWSFWGVFSHPPTQKRSFGYKSSQNSIFLAPKYHFPLDLFGFNFQWPTAHPQQFSDRVPPPPPGCAPISVIQSRCQLVLGKRKKQNEKEKKKSKVQFVLICILCCLITKHQSMQMVHC